MKITAIIFSKFAEKQILKLPNHIKEKILSWAEDVKLKGIYEVRKTSGYHINMATKYKLPAKFKGLKSAHEVLEKLVGPFNFAMWIRAARTGTDLTQAQMAKKLGISRAMLCDIEKGRQNISVKLAKKIANIAQLDEQHAIELCLQDQLERAKIKYTVKLLAKSAS